MEWVIIILLTGKRFRAISYCPECKEEMSFDELEDNLKICPYCGMYDCSLKIKVGEN